jgi:AcrR family transcriptional regulator
LLDAAVALFRVVGCTNASVTEIAAAADAFPSQVTYYFKSKEALFVEAACRELLHLAKAAEEAAANQVDRARYFEALVEVVAPDPALAMIIEAMTLVRRRPDLAPLIARTFERLHEEGARAYGAMQNRRRWAHISDPRAESERFWALAVGVSLRVASTGALMATCTEEMLKVLRMEPLKAGLGS